MQARAMRHRRMAAQWKGMEQRRVLFVHDAQAVRFQRQRNSNDAQFLMRDVGSMEVAWAWQFTWTVCAGGAAAVCGEARRGGGRAAVLARRHEGTTCALRGHERSVSRGEV